MSANLSFIKKNRAFSITMANIIFYVLAVIVNDPFEWFKSTYTNAEPFFQVSKDKITKINISKTSSMDSSFSIEKKDGMWIVHQKMDFEADSEKIDTLLKSIVNAKKYTIITSSKDKASEFGFKNPDEMKIEVFEGSVSKGYVLLGSLSSQGSYTHTKWKEEDSVYLVEDNLKANAGRGKFDEFIQKKLTPVDVKSEDLLAIFLEAPEPAKSYELVRSVKNWKLQKPIEKEIETEKLNTLISKAINLRASDVVLDDSYKENLLETPYKLKFNFKQKNVTKTISIEILGQNKENKSYYLKKEGQQTIFKTSEYELKPFIDWEPEK